MREMKFVGSRYKETSNLNIAEIAKIIRADVRKAVKDGALPKGLEVSVRIERFAGGQSLDIRLKSLGEAGHILNPARVKLEHEDQKSCPCVPYSPHNGIGRYTATATRVIGVLKDMKDSFNYDDSDYSTDYFNTRFYGDVAVDWKAEDADSKSILASGEFPDLSAKAEPEVVTEEPSPKPGLFKISALAIPVFYLPEAPRC